ESDNSRCRGRFFYFTDLRTVQLKELPPMQSTLSRVKRIATTSAMLIMAPALVVCSGDSSTATISPPGSVSDLTVSAIASSSVTLTFTQVDDGTGEAANYDVRYAVAPISWGAPTATASGTCSTPVTGTGIG